MGFAINKVMNNKIESKLERANRLGYAYECELCGTVGLKGNSQSKCEWSMMGTHSWKLVRNTDD